MRASFTERKPSRNRIGRRREDSHSLEPVRERLPRFVRAHQCAQEGGASVLVLPDFTGDFLFNTLGNLTVHPLAGLLFVDFASGDLLQLTGRTEIVWDGDELASFAGAQRLLRVTVEEGRRHVAALPPAWSEPDFARQLDDTGSWPESAS